MSRTVRSRLIAPLAWLVAMGGAGAAAAATEAELQSAVFRAKPAVVMVGVRIGATATIEALDNACGAIRKTREQLEQQLKQLDEVGSQLESAGRELRSAYQELQAKARAHGPDTGG